MTKGEVESIVDPSVRRKVMEKLTELETDDPKKAFAAETNLPFFQTADGRRIPIKKARVEKAVLVVKLGTGARERHVTSESNHHVEIYAEMDDKGREREWVGEVVSMLSAYERKQRGEPVVQRSDGPLVQFKFSLAKGDTLVCDTTKGGRQLLVVRGFSEDKAGYHKVAMVPMSDARLKKEIGDSGGWITKSPNELRKWNARKVSVGPLGEITEAHD